MKKPISKIVCAALASVVALGTAAVAGCTPYYAATALDGDYSEGTVISNGGFAVEKGNYVYFINGVQGNSADNNFGTPVKGSIMRIATTDLDNRNYANAQTVVPLIAYAGNYNAGIFVYGDYVYYSTPSTARNSDGEVLNSYLDFKSTKLDGTETLRDPYVQFQTLANEYRYVAVDDTVYLMYVASGEKLYDESTGVTNLHSLNTATGEDTLLAYNISSYLFDDSDKSNPRVFYTMAVKSYAIGSDEGYNQLYTVTADTTTANEYDTSSLEWWDDDTDRYINCGTLVFDGIGTTYKATPFNYDFNPEKTEKTEDTQKNGMSYVYTLQMYTKGHLFYTRHTANNPNEYLFDLKVDDITDNWNPVSGNPLPESQKQLLNDGEDAQAFKYIFDGDEQSGYTLSAVLSAESGGGITINYVKDGKLGTDIKKQDYFRIVNSGSATLLFTEDDYLYYSLSGGNGYTFHRIKYTGTWGDYNGMTETDEIDDFKSVKLLDLDSASDWYAPELLHGTLMFASETDNMTSYNYIMAFNLKNDDGDIMTNAEIKALNDLYDGIIGDDGIIEGYTDTDNYDEDIYANLANAARYLFYTADKVYIDDLAVACNAEVEDGDPAVYSEQTLNKLADFLAPAEGNDWEEYTDTHTVNGEEVYANRRDYYYSILGKMTDEDAESYDKMFKSQYLRSWPEEETVTWWEGLDTVARVFFIIGMCLVGILVIGGITVCTIVIIRKVRSKKMPSYTRRRIKVDTTDDKDINVYED